MRNVKEVLVHTNRGCLANLINNYKEESFIFTLLDIYGFVKTTMNRK